MWIIVVAWMYVAVLMAVAEAVHPGGSVGGAVATFFLYGLGPMCLVIYLLNSPARRKRLRQQEAAQQAPLNATEPLGSAAGLSQPTLANSVADANGGGHAAGDPIAAVGKKL